MGDGKFFLSEEQLVAAEKEGGLRPRLKVILSFMYVERISTKYACKPSSGRQVSRIPDNHTTAFISEFIHVKANQQYPAMICQSLLKYIFDYRHFGGDGMG